MKDHTSYKEGPKEEKRLDVYPIKKGKRILLYLCDLIITLFFSFTLFMILVAPVSQSITGLANRQAASKAAREERNTVLVENKILNQEYLTQSLSDEMAYTAKEYAKLYCGLTTTAAKPDVFRTFYFEIRSDYEDKYVTAFKDSNSQGFFSINESTKLITLNEPYKTNFKDGLVDGFTKDGQKEYDKYYNSYFLGMYGTIITDIKKNDLESTTDLRSYNTCQNVINSYEKYFKTLVVVDVFIAFTLGVSICYILVPLINKTHKTASMYFMKIEKVYTNSLETTKKSSILIELIYHITTNLFLVFFIPLTSVGMNTIFDLPVLFPISLVSIGIVLLSLIILLFDQYNRPLSNRLTNTVMISDDTLDDIYKTRGYDV